MEPNNAADVKADELSVERLSAMNRATVVETRTALDSCDMNDPPLTAIERVLVAALVSAIVKELQNE